MITTIELGQCRGSSTSSWRSSGMTDGTLIRLQDPGLILRWLRVHRPSGITLEHVFDSLHRSLGGCDGQAGPSLTNWFHQLAEGFDLFVATC